MAGRALARLRRRTAADPAPSLISEREWTVLSSAERRIIERSLPLSITSVARLQAVIDAVNYCVRRGLAGDFAECGVWRGGSVLAMVLALQDLGVEDRDIHLYDTFEGMTAPSEHDVSAFDPPALETWKHARVQDSEPWPEYFDPETFNLDSVRSTLASTGYPDSRLHFVRGRVEDTLPERAPERLAMLRLDTDWYESTRHELAHLYPRLVDGGVLIIDDYGHWEGCRKAVDEYFERHPPGPLLTRIDYSGRIAVKH